MIFLSAFIITFILSILLTKAVKSFAVSQQIVDHPQRDITRKIHPNPVPLLGGLAIFLAFTVISLGFYFFHPLLSNNIPLGNMAAIWLGGALLILGGVLDDVYDLSPAKQILFPLIAVIIVILAGIGIPHITNPFGGKIALSGPMVLSLPLLSGLFVFLWMLGMIYTTKFLDGLDGLASSIGTVAAFALFALSFTPAVQQSYTALLAIIFAGALAGFLIFNWHPAKIFLGEGGSIYIGFILGILSIIAGGKVATAFLVMGIPILDVAWVLLRRLFTKKSIFKADRGHLHFRLLDLGLSQPRVVGIFVTVSAIFGGVAVLMQSMGKLLALVVLTVFMIGGGLSVVYLNKKRTLDLLKNKSYN